MATTMGGGGPHAQHTLGGHGGDVMADSTAGYTERRNVDIVRGCYEAFGRGDIPAVLDLLTEDVEWTLQGPPAIPFAGTRRGRGEVAQFFDLVGQTLEFLRFEPREFVAQGDAVVVLGFERSLAKSTGGALEQEWAHVYGLRDGKIAAFRAFEDTAAHLAASGTN